MGKSVRIKDVLPKWKRIQRRSPFGVEVQHGSSPRPDPFLPAR